MNWAASQLATRSRHWSVLQNGIFLEEYRLGKGAVNNKNNSFWARAYFFRGKEQEWFFVLQIAPSGKWGGVGGGLHDSLSCWCLVRKFQTSWFKLHFWERLKLQLDQVVKLGFASWAFSTINAILGLWFFFLMRHMMNEPLLVLSHWVLQMLKARL